MQFQITVEGLEQLAAVLERLENLQAFFDPAMKQWAEETRSNELAGMGNYPPPRGYDRTGELGDSHTVTARGPSEYEFDNTAAHGPYVIGPNQAWMHEGYWWTMQERIEGEIPALLEALEQALDDAFG